jgi:hypothetical protein
MPLVDGKVAQNLHSFDTMAKCNLDVSQEQSRVAWIWHAWDSECQNHAVCSNSALFSYSIIVIKFSLHRSFPNTPCILMHTENKYHFRCKWNIFGLAIVTSGAGVVRHATRTSCRVISTNRSAWRWIASGLNGLVALSPLLSKLVQTSSDTRK